MLVFFGYLLTGVIAGTLSGLLGIGGGVIIVPALSGLLLYAGIDHQIAIHMAVATSLTSIVVSSFVSSFSHYREGHIQWALVRKAAPALLICVVLGSFLSTLIHTHALKLMISAVLIFVAYRLFRATIHKVQTPKEFPPTPQYLLSCGAFGALGAMVGAGGGIFLVPYFSRYGMAMRHAAGTSIACTFLIALTGAISYMSLSANNTIIAPGWHTGYIYWPAFIGIILTSIWCAPLGVKLSKHLPSRILKRIFAIVLVAVAVKMLFS